MVDTEAFALDELRASAAQSRGLSLCPGDAVAGIKAVEALSRPPGRVSGGRPPDLACRGETGGSLQRREPDARQRFCVLGWPGSGASALSGRPGAVCACGASQRRSSRFWPSMGLSSLLQSCVSTRWSFRAARSPRRKACGLFAPAPAVLGRAVLPSVGQFCAPATRYAVAGRLRSHSGPGGRGSAVPWRSTRHSAPGKCRHPWERARLQVSRPTRTSPSQNATSAPTISPPPAAKAAVPSPRSPRARAARPGERGRRSSTRNRFVIPAEHPVSQATVTTSFRVRRV
jgi:hypothetical protein